MLATTWCPEMPRRGSRAILAVVVLESLEDPAVPEDNGPAFSKRTLISAENTRHSNCLDARDHLPHV
jgi:hypothetical protein